MQVRSKFVVVSLFALVACGDEDADGGGGTGGVSRSKKVGDLSVSEARSFCKSLQGKFAGLDDDIAKLSCTFQSAFTSPDESACEAAIPDCVKNTPSMFEELDCDTDDGETGLSDRCDEVTVGELNDCMDANVDALQALAKKVTCSTDLTDAQELGGAGETPAACKAIETKCPDVADVSTDL